MKSRYVEPPGSVLVIDGLRSPKARDLAERLARGGLAYASLVECRTADSFDVVVLEVETEVPQIREHDIRPIERLAVCFDHADAQDARYPGIAGGLSGHRSPVPAGRRCPETAVSVRRGILRHPAPLDVGILRAAASGLAPA